ncbi:MAG: transposase [Ktedonobacteraceae bacterium]
MPPDCLQRIHTPGSGLTLDTTPVLRYTLRMHKMFQYRLYPTKKQVQLLNATLDECRWLYNHLLENRKTAYEQRGESLSCYRQIETFPLLKQDRPSLKTVHSQVLQNVAMRIDLAFKGFFRRCKAGETPGFPRFRGPDRYDSFTFPQSGFSIVSVPPTASHDERVVLSKIGRVKMVYHRSVKGKVKTCTLHKSSTGKWYAYFSVECEPERLPDCTHAVGIDVGLKTFATLSTGEEISAPKFFRQEEKALAKVQRKHATLVKGTPERRKHRKVVARVHERIGFHRDNFTHQEARQIVNRFGVICVEDLQVKRMTHNHCLAKSICDAAWSQFFDRLSSKAEEAGRTFIKVNPAYTSQECSRCHHRQKMPLSERTYHCPYCFLSIDRDLNAAVNIKAVGLHRMGLSLEAPLL